MKGGEIVQVGGLGSVNTLIADGKSPTVGNGGNFSSLLGSVMGNGVNTQKSQSFDQVFADTSNQELEGILDLLKSADIFDVKDGNKLLDTILNSDSKDLLSAIKDFLGLNDQDLKELVKNIQSMLSNVSVDKTEKNGSAINAIKADDSIGIPQVETTGSKELDELIACLNQISALPIQTIPEMINQDFHEIVKVVKLYELAANNQDGPTKSPKLTEQIQQTIQKLEAVIEQNKGSLRTEYLQKTFSSALAEIKSSQQTVNGKKENPVTTKIGSSGGMVHLNQMSRPEQIMAMLDKSGKPVSTDQLIKQFGNILAKSQYSKAGGTQKLLIKLNPENLGSLRIELTQKDSIIIAKIMTSSGVAKNILESQLQGLKNAFSSQNIQVDRVEVTQQSTNQQESAFHKEQRHGQQQNEQKPSEEQQNEGEFNLSFEEALLNIEV